MVKRDRVINGRETRKSVNGDNSSMIRGKVARLKDTLSNHF